jgi:hypothetical protein
LEKPTLTPVIDSRTLARMPAPKMVMPGAWWFLLEEGLGLGYGPMPAKEIQELAAKRGISLTSLRRAKRQLGIKAYKSRGLDGCWMWRFPDREPRDPDPPAPGYSAEDVASALQGMGWVETGGRWKWPNAPKSGPVSPNKFYTFPQAFRLAALEYRREKAEREEREWKHWSDRRRRRGAEWI